MYSVNAKRICDLLIVIRINDRGVPDRTADAAHSHRQRGQAVHVVEGSVESLSRDLELAEVLR